MNCRLIAFDLDGTFLDDYKKVPADNLHALETAAHKGIIVVPASGRLYPYLPDEVKAQRKADGLKTTIYTCCGPLHPNTFTFSPLAESEYIGLSAAARNYSGYLRWALFSWPEDPCKDSRFGKWLSGDTYLLYPEGSSLRFERLIEGIQDYEKIRILKENADPKTLAKIEAILAPFKEIITDESINASETVAAAKAALNKL